MESKIFSSIISNNNAIIDALKPNALNANIAVQNIYNSGIEALLHTKTLSKQPAILFIDMAISTPDPLVLTAICNKLFPATKIIAFDTTSGLPLHNAYTFIVVGGRAYIGGSILNPNSMVYKVYNNSNMFSTLINNVLQDANFYIDPTLYSTTNHQQALQQLQSQVQEKLAKYKFLTKQEKLYLHLKVAGFKRDEKAKLLDVSLATVKKRAEKLRDDLDLQEIEDLILFAIQNGLVLIKNRIG
jgi:DNA-binding NarL/FixJ family response regulator